METTIIMSHPYPESFNYAIFNEVTNSLEEKNIGYNVIDLYKDNFDPVLSQADLACYNDGKTTDKMVDKYNEILDKTERVILIFPIWWYDMPAMMRGFFDKVMLHGKAYYDDENGLHPIRAIKETIIYTTSYATTNDLINEFGDPINGVIINGTFKAIGFVNAKWYNLGSISDSSYDERVMYLEEIKSHL